MKLTKILMGMPIIVEIADKNAVLADLEKVFSYFQYVDEKFSVYKSGSEISAINDGKIKKDGWSADMKEVFELSEKTKKETGGYFDIQKQDGKYDPSGLVKGWAIWNAAKLLKRNGFKNFYVSAGGDIQISGKNGRGEIWSVGIKNPFNGAEVIKIVYLPNDEGIATSGTYERGQHIYNPKEPGRLITDIVSLSVIGENVYEADRFATAAFAMGKKGIDFIEKQKGLEGYVIDKNGTATMTTGFSRYLSSEM